MNRTLEVATGEYVVFLCADDFWFPGFLRREVELLDQNPSVSFVHCGACGLESNVRTSQVYTWPPIVTGREFVIGLFSGRNSYFFSSVMARRELVLKVGGFDAAFPYNTDQYTWLCLALEGDVGYVADCLAGGDSRGALSEKFSKRGRFLVEELRTKRKFIDVACSRVPEFARLRQDLLSLMCLSVMRGLLTIRRAGEGVRAALNLWRRCVSMYPPVLASPFAWLCLGGGLLPPALLTQIKHRARRGTMPESQEG